MYSKFFARFEDQALQVEFFSTIVDNLPVAVFCKDVMDDSRVIVWNKTAEQLFGREASDVLGKNAYEYLPKEVADRYTEADRTAILENKMVFVANQVGTNFKTNEEVLFRVWKLPIETKQGMILLCIAQDLSATKRVEREYQRQERQLQSISENSPGLLYQFKADPQKNFSFTFFSAKAFNELGIMSEEIVRSANVIIDLIHEDDMASFQQSLVVTMQELSPWHWEGRFNTATKGLRWFKGASIPALQDDGSILWDGILFDITSQKETEERLRLQDAKLAATSKLVALGEMAGGVAHEINTPLNAILFCAEQIQNSVKEEALDQDEVLEMSGLISETAQRIAKIVRGLKTFARDGSNEPLEEAELESLVDQTLSLCRERMELHGVKLIFEKAAVPTRVNCRSVQMGQVILNLLNNAFDAIVGTDNPWVKVGIRSSATSVFLEVTDSGQGLSEEVKAKLFQPFFTTKELGKGTGIGLSISRGIIEGHKGSITVDDNSPNTKFVIEIPFESQLQEAV